MRAFFGVSAEGGAVVSLSRDGSVLAISQGSLTDDLLALFEAVLKKAKSKKKAVKEIVVDRGPSGFSAVRRRVAVATALGLALGVPLAAVGEISPEEAASLPETAFAPKARVHPIYAAEPNITISKKKKTWSAH